MTEPVVSTPQLENEEEPKKPVRVLVVDDDDDGLYILKLLLSKMKYEVHTAKDGEEALYKAEELVPDIILLDVMMPKLNGFEVCKRVKATPEGMYIPIILLTAKSELMSKIEGLDCGADEYLTKPYDMSELTARIRSMLRIKQLNDSLRTANRQLEELSVTDELTRLYNRRYINKKLEDEFRRAIRYKRPLTCLMFDADHFKSVNDTHGHKFGDVVLKDISKIIHDTVRLVDICGRFGGEEFIALLPDTDQENAITLAERIRKKIEMHEFRDGDIMIHRTVSVGVSAVPDDLIKDEFQLVEWADKALYEAKGTGRNKVISHSDLQEYKEMAAR
ncbi:MAG: diguanylate cyclase [Bacteroidetes bacterium]|nr:diguanylate cyclase [Bacteroidota bacterium]